MSIENDLASAAGYGVVGAALCGHLGMVLWPLALIGGLLSCGTSNADKLKAARDTDECDDWWETLEYVIRLAVFNSLNEAALKLENAIQAQKEKRVCR